MYLSVEPYQTVLFLSQVMQAYQAGVAALRLSLKDVSVEKAESLVDQIQEVRYPCCCCECCLYTPVALPADWLSVLFVCSVV